MGESHENLDMGFQQGDESILNCHSSGLSSNSQAQKVAGMAMSSLTMARPSDGHAPDPFIGSWDPLGSLNQAHSEFASSSYSAALGNQGINNVSHLVQYGTSDSSFAELVPKIHGFARGNFSEMVGSFGLPECSELANTGYRNHYNPNKELGFESSSVHRMQSQDQQLARKEEIIRSASYVNKRKREPEPNSSSSPNKNTEGEELKDSGKSSNRKEQEDKSRIEQQSTSDLRGKQTAKQDKDDSHSGEAPKENFVHVRARRGQATNSHSLAERVRREKISERMRLLQELVPGCNKITGKAVMLDEIINYVQSLQQQVEFLSMKLATVNPEMNFDIERIFSKDILNSRMGNSAILGLGTGMNYSLPFRQPSFPGTHPSIPSTIAQFPLPPTMGDQDFQSMLQMGYDSAAAIDNLGPNGRLKSEL